MAQAIAASGLDEARRLHFALLPLIDTLFTEPNPGPLKAALAQLGLSRAEVRPPMSPASATLSKEIAGVLDRLRAFR